MTYLFYSIRASPAQMRCEPSCTAYLFPHFCHRFAPPKTTSLPKKFFSFAVKRCIMLLECAAFCFLWEIFVICQQSLPLQFIPARGRKLWQNRRRKHPDAIAIYPREGTKTRWFKQRRTGQVDCNLSPRGDENIPEVNHNHATAIAIYPREGTKTLQLEPLFSVNGIAIYPREGTKTYGSASY